LFGLLRGWFKLSDEVAVVKGVPGRWSLAVMALTALITLRPETIRKSLTIRHRTFIGKRLGREQLS
jgi:hypothetical protein